MTTPELDLLVELAYEAGALAARMTGGGFGGSVVALTDPAQGDELARTVTAAYADRTGRRLPGCARLPRLGGGEGAVIPMPHRKNEPVSTCSRKEPS